MTRVSPHRTLPEAVVVGTSAGGLKALMTLFSSLSAVPPWPLIVVQHLHADAATSGVEVLSEKCALRIREVEDKEPIQEGIVYLCPPNYHLLIESDRTFSLSVDEKVNYARPSIDVFFESAAEVFGEKLVGIILTGANHDGAKGLRAVKEHGGTTIVQSPETAECDAMPRAAIEMVKVARVLPLEEIGRFLMTIGR